MRSGISKHFTQNIQKKLEKSQIQLKRNGLTNTVE